MNLIFIYKSLLFAGSFIANVLLSEYLHRYLTKSIERAFYNSQIDHIMFQHKMKSVFYLCTSIFLVILIFSYFLINSI